MSVEHYENFPVASWLVPARVRPAIVAIYAFARGADDLADEGDVPTAVRLAALDRYVAMLDAIERGETPGEKPFDALARAIRTHALPIEPFRDLLSAFRQDVTTPRYAAFADVLDQNFVGLDRASAIQRFLADKAARAGKPLRLRIQLRSFDAVCRMVESNVGVGIVPETTARRAARTMAIASVALKDTWALRELTICVRDLEGLPNYARQLVDYLRTGKSGPLARSA